MIRACFIFLLTTLSATSVYAVRTIPRLSSPVVDEVRLLSSPERADLDELLRSFLPQIQMQIWVVKSLDGEAIESLSIRAADQWKLGTEKADNGLLILVATEDRQMRVEVGQGLEGDIPDALAARVIDQILRPSFRSQQYAAGLREAAIFLNLKATGQTPQEPAPQNQRSAPQPLRLLLMFIIVVFWIISSLVRRRGFFGGVSSGGFGGGWGGGGFGGGGGGWSGGGGGFSGGGSSGRW